MLIKPLESHNIKCLYKSNGNYKHELKKLNHSILMSYLDLLDILVKAPNKIGKTGRTLREEKLDDLNILFSNISILQPFWFLLLLSFAFKTYLCNFGLISNESFFLLLVFLNYKRFFMSYGF